MKIRRPQLAQTKKMEARAVGMILTREDRVLVGYLYEWNTGERQNGVCQDSYRLHPFSRCAIFGPGRGAAAASFMGERVGGPMASAPGFGSLWIEPDRADGLPVARPT
jgi:hypothetical protein